jgi:hypothetical protein
MKTRTRYNEQPGVEGDVSIAFDVMTVHIETRGSGFWSVPQIGLFFEDWRDIVEQIHAAGRTVSAFVDLTDAAIQRVEVADIIASETMGLYADDDALAMLVSTSLAKMQMQRVLDPRFHSFFLSRTAAQTWLRGRRFVADTHPLAASRAT